MTKKERELAEKAIELTMYNQNVKTFNHNCGVAAVRGTFYERFCAKRERCIAKYRTAKS